MGKRTFLKVALPVLVLVAFLLGVLIFDRVQTAWEQAYLATATVYIPPTTTTPPPTTTTPPPTTTTPPPTAGPTYAPAFSVIDGAGKVYNMADFAGKPTVLCFWNGGYTDARGELPIWETILEKYEDAVHLVVVHVNDDKTGMQAAKAYLEEEKFSFTPYFDLSGDAARAYNIGVFPTTFFINAQAQLKARARGNISPENLRTGLERIGLSEQ